MIAQALIVIALVIALVKLGQRSCSVERHVCQGLCVIAAVALSLAGLIADTPRQCADMRALELLKWEQSPFRGHVNYVGSWERPGGGLNGVWVKVEEDSGERKFLALSAGQVTFVGTRTTRPALLRYDVTPLGRIWAISWQPRYVVTIHDSILATGENELLLSGMAVHHLADKGSYPALLQWIGEGDAGKLEQLVPQPKAQAR